MIGGGVAGSPFVRVEYDKMPFDVSREQLPPRYGGHNVQDVYNAIKNNPAMNRGQMEGQNTALGTALYMTTGSTFAFQITPAYLTYEKHEQMMRAYCQLWKILAKGSEDGTKNGFRIEYIPTLENRSTYKGADGRDIEIEEIKFREYTIAFENLVEFRIERGRFPDKQTKDKDRPAASLDDTLKDDFIVAAFPAKKADAEALEANLKLLAICNLAGPYATSEIVRRVSTPERPGEYLAEHDYVHVRLLELWFYDALMGKVLAKIRPYGITK